MGLIGAINRANHAMGHGIDSAVSRAVHGVINDVTTHSRAAGMVGLGPKPKPGAATPGLGTRLAQQRELIAAGYHIGPANGQNSKPFQMAWKNYQAALRQGLHPAHAATYWNAHSGLALNSTSPAPATPQRGAGQVKPGASSNPVTTSAPSGKAGGGRGPRTNGNGQPNLSSLLGKSAGIPSLANYSTGLANMGSIPTSFADQMANLQFDPKIQAEQQQQADNVNQFAQNLADIKNWYGQVMASQGRAGTRDTAASQAAQGAMKSNIAGILASLGGAANQGAGMVGSAGANDLGTLAALGQSQDQYNADIAPIMQLEQSSQQTAEKARQSKVASDLAAQIASDQGAKGAAKATALMNIMQYNQSQAAKQRSILLGIEQANNQLAQQRFGDQQAINAQNQAALYNGARASYYLNKPSGTSTRNVRYTYMTAPHTVVARAASDILAATKGLDYQTAVQRAAQIAKGYFSGAEPMQTGTPLNAFIGGLLQQNGIQGPTQ